MTRSPAQADSQGRFTFTFSRPRYFLRVRRARSTRTISAATGDCSQAIRSPWPADGRGPPATPRRAASGIRCQDARSPEADRGARSDGEPARAADRRLPDRAVRRGRRHARHRVGRHGARAARTRPGIRLRRGLRLVGGGDHRGLAGQLGTGPAARLGRPGLRQDADPLVVAAARPPGRRRPRAGRGRVPDRQFPMDFASILASPVEYHPLGTDAETRRVDRPAPADRDPGRAAARAAGERLAALPGRSARGAARPALLRRRAWPSRSRSARRTPRARRTSWCSAPAARSPLGAPVPHRTARLPRARPARFGCWPEQRCATSRWR